MEHFRRENCQLVIYYLNLVIKTEALPHYRLMFA